MLLCLLFGHIPFVWKDKPEVMYYRDELNNTLFTIDICMRCKAVYWK